MYNLLPRNCSGMNIGVLGGSFNPPHTGHLYIALEAIKRMDLDIIIWCVTPSNPLKAGNASLSLEQRLALCKDMCKDHPRIIVVDYERHLPNNYTITLILRIKQLYKNANLYYIMGADNIIRLHLWKRWHEIVKNTKIIILDRNSDHKMLLSSKFYHFYKDQYNKRWFFLKIRKNPLSSTYIRSCLNGLHSY